MKKSLNHFIKSMVFTIGVVGICGAVSAETPKFHEYYGVEGWENLIPNVQHEYQRYRQEVLQDASLPEVIKVKNIGEKYDEIRRSLIYNRKSVYASFSEQHHVVNTAVKPNLFTVAKSAPKCFSPEKEELYTIAEWVKGAYQKNNESVVSRDVLQTGVSVDAKELIKDEGKTVCTVALEQDKKGRAIAYTEASFRISPQYINHIVNAEVTHIMQQITQSKERS